MSLHPDEIADRRCERFFGSAGRPDYGICPGFERIGDQLWQAAEIASALADRVPGGYSAVIARFRFSVRAGSFGPPASSGRFVAPGTLSYDQRSRAGTTRNLVDLDSAVLRPPEPGQYALRPSILIAGDFARYMRARQSVWAHWIAAQGWPVPPDLRAPVNEGEATVVDDRRVLPASVRERKSTKDAIRAAVEKLGKARADFRTFEEFRRAVCGAGGVDSCARGWGEDSMRRALK